MKSSVGNDKKNTVEPSAYGVREPTPFQRATMTVAIGLFVVAVWWWELGGGIGLIGRMTGHHWLPGDYARRVCLVSGLTIYYLRLLATIWIFLKRSMSWAEMFVITVWVLFIFVFLGICGGRDTVGIGPLDGVAFALFAAGSWMNSWSEYARDVWKQRSENQGHLYTIGLFRLCRHPNYLGDLMSFSGLCLLTGAWVTALVPVLMLLSFVTVNIPQLDAYLHQRYGAEFDDYAAKTRKLIPFVY